MKRYARREFLRALGAGAAGAGLLGAMRARAAAKDRPNVLWIISEDTGPEFGCYGYPLVHTPNVDRLAAEGARFTNACTTGAVCSASRSAFMTGMYQTTIGAHHHRSHRRDGYTLPDPVHVFTKYFRDAGYFTALCGKGKTDWNFKPKVKPYDSHKWEDLKTHQPFFAQYQFGETHRKFKHCPEHPVDPAKVTLPPYYPDHPVARQDWALYLETVNVLDQKIGEVLARLEKDGMAENTIVFYFGDHGRAHARGKQWMYDGGIHVPLVIRAPGLIRPGTVVDEVVSAIDFAPTCLKLCGIEPPEHMQGRVFLGPDRDKPREVVPQLHAGTALPATEPVQGTLVSDDPADAPAAQGGETDARPAALHGRDATRGGTLRPRGRPLGNPQPRPGSRAPGHPPGHAKTPGRLDRAHRRQGPIPRKRRGRQGVGREDEEDLRPQGPVGRRGGLCVRQGLRRALTRG